jgi:hypothetical protein
MQMSQTSASSASAALDPFPLKIVEPIHRMRGQCQSHFMRGEDDTYYVVKSPQNPQGSRTLVNELLCSLVALDLQLPVAKPKIVFVGQTLIDYTEDLYFEIPGAAKTAKTKWRASLCYGSQFPVNPHEITCLDFLPAAVLQHLGNLSAFAGALVLDLWFANADPRQAVFFRQTPYFPYQAVLIDHGLCFNGDKWTFEVKPVANLYWPTCVYGAIQTLDDFEPWLTQVESVTIARLRSFIPAIPPEWFCHDFKRLHRLLDQLVLRTAVVRSLIASLCENTPTAFPKWRSGQGVQPLAKTVGEGR